MKFPNCFLIFIILGNVFLVLGLLSYYALPSAIDMFIDSQIVLRPNSQSFPMWKVIPVPIYQKFYFFNVTNAQDIEQFGHKPILEEIGPFTYRSDLEKRDIEFDDAQKLLNFKQYKKWTFEPEMSIADHRLQLVTLNAPLAITLTLIQSASNAVRLLVTFSLDGLSEGFFTKRSVKQLLFDGYPDLLTTFGPLLNAEMLSQGGHFGYMNAKNNSEDGAYEIFTGVSNITKLNTINRFNGRQKLPYWSSTYGQCNSLEGASTGEIFPPVPDSDEFNSSLKLFQPDLCRVWPLNYDSKFELPNGLKLKRYKASRDVFKNSSDLLENSCYFPNRRPPPIHDPGSNRVQDQNRVGRLARNRQQQVQQQLQQQSNPNRHHTHHRIRHEWPAGVFTLAPCKFNAPIYISMPHFLDAEPFFSSKVDGLEPDANKHEFYIDLEPRTGSPVMLSARVQINVAISKPPGLVRFRNVPEIMFPVFWQELSVNVSGPVIDQLLLASKGAQEATVQISYGLLLIGGIVLIVGAVLYIHVRLINVDTKEKPTTE